MIKPVGQYKPGIVPVSKSQDNISDKLEYDFSKDRANYNFDNEKGLF